jgi:hypothetical protein
VLYVLLNKRVDQNPSVITGKTSVVRGTA